MIELGKIQNLVIVRMTSVGAFLNTTEEVKGEDILLPKNQLSPEAKVGDSVEVFVYKDSEDRMIATARKPKITIEKMAGLKVVDTTNIGAFLDWGLEKDLFLPYKEQVGRVVKDGICFVALYIDKSERLCATMKTYNLLSTESPYKANDRVRGTVCSVNKELGAFIAVEDKYQGLIPNKELYGQYNIGENIEVRIKKVQPDGKLELSVRNQAFKEIDNDAEKIMKALKENDGILNLNDSSAPEAIKSELQMSKAAFKRAVGRLLKQGAIKTTEKGITLII